MQVQRALQQRFGAQLLVTLQNHPPPPAKALLAQVLLAAQLVIAAVVLMGRQAEALSPYLARVGIVVLPEQWQAMADKKTAILMSVWFIGTPQPGLA